jgi:hypothetical protein
MNQIPLSKTLRRRSQMMAAVFDLPHCMRHFSEPDVCV